MTRAALIDPERERFPSVLGDMTFTRLFFARARSKIQMGFTWTRVAIFEFIPTVNDSNTDRPSHFLDVRNAKHCKPQTFSIL